MGESDLVRLWMNKGWYEIRVGDRGGRFASRAPDFYDILSSLVRYHYELKTKHARWKKDIQVELPEPQLRALEGIIDLHNQIIDEVAKRQVLAAV